VGQGLALQWRHARLTRRRSKDAREECWHVYYGDVHVGTIAIRSGNPADTITKNLSDGEQIERLNGPGSPSG
jgi:hypothetical protein